LINVVHNSDCLPVMREMSDNQFDLAIVDPPYGIGISKNPFRQKHNKANWDSNIPTEEYFKELFRVSKDQIIWGGNYFNLPQSQGFIVWDKIQPFDFSSAMCEYAWISFQKPAKIFRKHVVTAETNKIHPTQKPSEMYRWLLKNYASQNDTILDTHVGSGSSRIACWKMGFDFTGYEIDKDYWDAQEKRFKIVKNQMNMFRNE